MWDGPNNKLGVKKAGYGVPTFETTHCRLTVKPYQPHCPAYSAPHSPATTGTANLEYISSITILLQCLFDYEHHPPDNAP